MPKTKIVSSIIALVLGLCVVVFTIAYFSINGKHNREGYTFEGDFFNGYSAGLTADSYGMGLNGSTQFETRVMNGDAYAMRSSYGGEVSGGMNLTSTVAMGAGTLAARIATSGAVTSRSQKRRAARLPVHALLAGAGSHDCRDTVHDAR